MSSNVYDVGDGVRATCTFTDLDGALANPTDVVASLKDPDGTVTTPTVQHPSTGVYYVDVTMSQSGYWYLRFEGTGAVIAAHEMALRVRSSQFA